jgi:hypothetical protein
MPRTTLSLTQAQQTEMFQSYAKKSATAAELCEMYDITVSTFYRMLHAAGLETHIKVKKVQPEVLVPQEIEVLHVPTQMAVVADKNGTVQSVKPIKLPNQSTWEIKYTGTIFVDAVDVEDAVAEARKLGMVKRIYSVRVKSS